MNSPAGRAKPDRQSPPSALPALPSRLLVPFLFRATMSSDSSKPLQVSRSASVLIALLALLPWAAVLALLLRGEAPHNRAAESAPAAAVVTPGAPGNGTSLPAGPWGDLAYTRVAIEPPDSLLAVPDIRAEPQVAWFFGGMNAGELARWWTTVALRPEEKSALADPARWEITAEGVWIRPAPALVLGLANDARARIYAQLSRFPPNGPQHTPFRFRAESTAEWFRDSGLSPATLALVEPLIYRRGTALLFSDTGLVLPRIPLQAERTRLIKALARRTTLMVQLRIHPDTDIDALERYWGRGQRSRDIGPLLRSLQRRDRTLAVDLIHLLPRTPRQLLHTYPLPDAAGQFAFLDCHWTSLNFFTLQPEQRELDGREVAAAIDRYYYLVTGKPAFGDIIMFARRDNSVIHSCIYLADDLVFTKNGGQAVSPWILMTLSDVLAFYPSEEPIELQYYRAKALAAP